MRVLTNLPVAKDQDLESANVEGRVESEQGAIYNLLGVIAAGCVTPICVSSYRLTNHIPEPPGQLYILSAANSPERPPLPIIRSDTPRPQTPPLDLTPLRDSLAQAFPNRKMYRNCIEVAIADYKRDQD